MEIEEVKSVQEKLKEIENKHLKLLHLEAFISNFHESKYLHLETKKLRLWFNDESVFDFVGNELIELLESKKTFLEKEIHNFTLDQLLPKEEDKNKGLGFKFITEGSHSVIDDGIYYYKLNNDGSSAIASWFRDGELETVSYDQEGIVTNEKNFESGRWTKI